MELGDIFYILKDNGELVPLLPERATFEETPATYEETQPIVVEEREETPGTREEVIVEETQTTTTNDDQVLSINTNEEVESSVASLPLGEDEIVRVRKNPGRPPRGRRRKKLQTKKERKSARNSNNRHFSESGKKVFERDFRDYQCQCKCYEKVPVEIREALFQKYWALADYNSQSAFIASLVREEAVKRKRETNSNVRKYSRTYTMNYIQVCKPIFIQSLRISSVRINTALKKVNRSKYVNDLRGKKSGGQQKLPKKSIKLIKRHIRSFPKYISHYCREKTEANFLREDCTVKKMFTLFREKHPEIKCSLASFKRIFLRDFNLKRKKYQKDTCNACDLIQVKIKACVDDSSKNRLEVQHDTHLKLAESARLAMKSDLAQCKEISDLECLTFDLEKTLPLPRIPTNMVYYKRQLNFYNLGIHSGKLNKGFCYTWTENIAGRGGQEVASCIKKHLQQPYFQNIRHLILWSDSCGGQNRNIKFILMMKACMEIMPNLQSISCKYLVSGHSMLPNDKDFSDIECALRLNSRIYTDNDYRDIIKTCRKNKLEVIEMRRNDFFGTGLIESDMITNRKTTIGKEKVNWLKTREIVLYKQRPYQLSMFHSFDNSLEENNNRQEYVVDIQKRVNQKSNAGRPAVHFFSKKLCASWPNGKPLALPKMKDLNTLIHLVPQDTLEFWNPILGGPTVDLLEDIEGFNCEQLDFEVEDIEQFEFEVEID